MVKKEILSNLYSLKFIKEIIKIEKYIIKISLLTACPTINSSNLRVESFGSGLLLEMLMLE